MISLLLLSITGFAASLDVGQFYNPPAIAGQSFGTNPVYTIGETQTIKWTTTFTDYTIALWQQSLRGNAANLGPIIFETARGDFPTFEWVVQTGTFDLSLSDVFFLWLHNGTASNQGAKNVPSFASHYFNITVNDTLDSPPLNLSSAAQPPTLSTLAQVIQTSSTSPVVPTSATPVSKGLSTGVQAGIIVGASAVGLTVIAAAILLFSRMRKNKKAREATTFSKNITDNISHDAQRMSKSWTILGLPPSELDGRPGGLVIREPVELG